MNENFLTAVWNLRDAGLLKDVAALGGCCFDIPI